MKRLMIRLLLYFAADSAAARWIRIPSAAPHLVEHHAGAYLISQHKRNVYHDMLRQSIDATPAAAAGTRDTVSSLRAVLPPHSALSSQAANGRTVHRA